MLRQQGGCNILRRGCQPLRGAGRRRLREADVDVALVDQEADVLLERQAHSTPDEEDAPLEEHLILEDEGDSILDPEASCSWSDRGYPFDQEGDFPFHYESVLRWLKKKIASVFKNKTFA